MKGQIDQMYDIIEKRDQEIKRLKDKNAKLVSKIEDILNMPLPHTAGTLFSNYKQYGTSSRQVLALINIVETNKV